jgi:phosphoglycolate phosphatase-like HAD superfamily hydrolase
LEGKSAVGAPPYRSFVFDLDGTLFTIPIDWIRVRSEIERTIGRKLGGASLFNQLSALIASNPEIRAPVFSVVDSFELQAEAQAQPKPGAIDFLASLAQRSKLALVTMQGRAICETLLARYKMERYFVSKLTREYSLDRSDQILEAIRSMGSTPRDTLFVGDLANDVVCARRSNVDVAIMGKGATSGPTPDYRFTSFAELAAFLT